MQHRRSQPPPTQPAVSLPIRIALSLAGRLHGTITPVQLLDLTHPHRQRVTSPVIDTDYNGELFVRHAYFLGDEVIKVLRV